MDVDVTVRARVLAHGFGLLCTLDGHPGGVRGLRVVYGWDPSPDVRSQRIERGLRLALRRRDRAQPASKSAR